jgi:7-cyano-7-deazaguanine synthase
MKIVTIYSGGLDSTVLLYHLQKEGHEQLAITFDYKQTHHKEMIFASMNCGKLNIPQYECYLEIPMHVPLTGNGEIPDGYYTDESMKQTIVPSRNATFLSIAWGVAVSLGAEAIAFGAHSGDRPIYPDCRAGFIDHMEKSLQLGTEKNLQILTPLLYKDKTDIVRLGDSLKVDFIKTWSCYKGKKYHCGKCGTCSERKEAFQLAGIKDPTIYKENE